MPVLQSVIICSFFRLIYIHNRIICEQHQCGRQNNDPPKMSISNPRTGEHVPLHATGEWRFQKKLSLLISWPWHREIILDYPSGPIVVTGSLQEEERNRRGRVRKTVVSEGLGLICWLWWWRMEPRKLAATRSEERQGHRISPGPPERNAALWAPYFRPVRSCELEL